MLPPSADEWLPDRHLARFVVEVIEQLDLSAMVKAYRGSGSAWYYPSVLLGLLVYGYAAGVFSSRKLERATCDSVAFRFIAANDHPDHDTIAAFRRRFLDRIEGLFVQVFLLAREAGSLLVVTADVVQAANDKQKIEPVLEQLGRLPDALGKAETLLADSGYFSQANVEACAEARIEPLIALGRERHHLSWKQRFAQAPPAPEDPTALEAMYIDWQRPKAAKPMLCASRPRNRCSASSNRSWASDNSTCAASKRQKASGTSLPWPGT